MKAANTVAVTCMITLLLMFVAVVLLLIAATSMLAIPVVIAYFIWKLAEYLFH
jgi:hypothetical protein